jgi:alpha-galactosidase
MQICRQSYRIAAMFVLSVICCAVSRGQADKPVDLHGRWLHEDVNEDGNRTPIILVLDQEGANLSGRVIFSWGEIHIRDGEVNGSTYHFEAMTPASTTQPAVYEGELKDGELLVRSRWPGNDNKDYSAEKTTDTAGDPPSRLPLPALHSLPWNGLAKTPPMGWNSWNLFQGKVNDAIVRAMADVMVSSGMRDAGYTYVNIDDTWEGERDGNGEIHANRKFPDMKALADYVHSKGLKLGIYSSPGPVTCAGYLGSYGHEDQDAKTYAAWGIDYLKYDFCSAGKIYGSQDSQALYLKMGEALQNSGRPIVYSLCSYGMDDVWKWGASVGGNLWRTTGDIGDRWKSMEEIGFAQGRLAPYAGPGHWNDPDMLEIGNGGMNVTEYRTHMTLWSMLAAPLLAGNDLRDMTPAIRDILMNREIIAVDQDPLGHAGTRVYQDSTEEVWIRPLENHAEAIAIFNRGDSTREISVLWNALKIQRPGTLRDLWEHRDIKPGADGLQVSVPAHGSVIYRIAK